MHKITTTKIFICLLAVFFLQSSILANPVPVFCLAGWISHESCKGISRIRETRPTGQDKWYYLYSSRIREQNPDGEDKWYYLYSSRIREQNPNGEDKWYYLYSSRIREQSPNGETIWYYCK